ncbi:MAG TPA: helix-turn-helix transcriptional regulator [Roseiflexaceae bacterium]|nr:helix-turn-helix transcriptional regulator [Roseiflexaceae bacterium]
MPQLLAQKIKHLRLRHNMTQMELAQRVGLGGHSHIVKVERGQRTISLGLIISMARVFNQPLEYFLRDTIPIDRINLPNTSTPTPLPEPDRVPYAFGTNLHTLRLQHGISQTVLARQLGLTSRAYISSLEAGEKLPSIDLLIQIADLFTVTTDSLLHNRTRVPEAADDGLHKEP